MPGEHLAKVTSTKSTNLSKMTTAPNWEDTAVVWVSGTISCTLLAFCLAGGRKGPVENLTVKSENNQWFSINAKNRYFSMKGKELEEAIWDDIESSIAHNRFALLQNLKWLQWAKRYNSRLLRFISRWIEQQEWLIPWKKFKKKNFS